MRISRALIVGMLAVPACQSFGQQIEAMVSTISPEVRGMKTAELMSENVVTVKASATVAEALKAFSDHTFHSLPLLDDDGKVLGLISESGLLDAIRNGAAARETLLKQLQAEPLPTVRPETPVTDAVERFCRSGKNKLLVVDSDGKLQGVLTPIDLMAKREGN